MPTKTSLTDAELISRLEKRMLHGSKRTLNSYASARVVVPIRPGKKGAPRLWDASAVDLIAGIQANAGGSRTLERAAFTAWFRSTLGVVPRAFIAVWAAEHGSLESAREVASFVRDRAPLEGGNNPRTDRAFDIAQDFAASQSKRVGLSEDFLAAAVENVIVEDLPLDLEETAREEEVALGKFSSAQFKDVATGLLNVEAFVAAVPDDSLLRGRRVAFAMFNARGSVEAAKAKSLGELRSQRITRHEHAEIGAVARMIAESAHSDLVELVVQCACALEDDADADRLVVACEGIVSYVSEKPKRLKRLYR
jgi:hypothetical protein